MLLPQCLARAEYRIAKSKLTQSLSAAKPPILGQPGPPSTAPIWRLRNKRRPRPPPGRSTRLVASILALQSPTAFLQLQFGGVRGVKRTSAHFTLLGQSKARSPIKTHDCAPADTA